MVEYKWISITDILGQYAAIARDHLKMLDPERLDENERIEALILSLKEMGLDGWKFTEVFKGFRTYLLSREGKEKWAYELVNMKDMEKKAMTLVSQRDAVLQSLNEKGKDGWFYCDLIFKTNPEPTLFALLARKITQKEADEIAEKLKQQKEPKKENTGE